MKKAISIIILFACTCASATQYSCLSIVTATKGIGKWEALKTWIALAGLTDEWNKCSYVSDAYPQFAAITNALVHSGVMTTQDIEQVLDTSKDTALPDELLLRVYHQDMSNETGRTRWHGKVTRVNFDTNALVKTTFYSDGYIHRQPFGYAHPPSLTDQLTTAQRREMARRKKEQIAAKKEEEKQKRINLLTTNMTAEVTALMAKRQWPEELARLYLQDELNKLVGTQTVTVEIGPQ